MQLSLAVDILLFGEWVLVHSSYLTHPPSRVQPLFQSSTLQQSA